MQASRQRYEIVTEYFRTDTEESVTTTQSVVMTLAEAKTQARRILQGLIDTPNCIPEVARIDEIGAAKTVGGVQMDADVTVARYEYDQADGRIKPRRS